MVLITETSWILYFFSLFIPIFFFHFVVAAVVLHFQTHCLARLIQSPESFYHSALKKRIEFLLYIEVNLYITLVQQILLQGSLWEYLQINTIPVNITGNNIAEHHRVRLWEYHLRNRGSEKVK